jgi:hypothetical protein
VRGKWFGAVTTPRYDGDANTAWLPIVLNQERSGNRMDCPTFLR